MTFLTLRTTDLDMLEEFELLTERPSEELGEAPDWEYRKCVSCTAARMNESCPDRIRVNIDERLGGYVCLVAVSGRMDKSARSWRLMTTRQAQ